jgi:hypothetical protein
MELSGEPTKGTYFNLDTGQMWAAKFELNAWSSEKNQGLYLNSDPANGNRDGSSLNDGLSISLPSSRIAGHYLKIGNENKGYISLEKNGNMHIKATNFELTYALG